MPSEEMYEPNSVTAVLSRLETTLNGVADTQKSMRIEAVEVYKRVHERIDETNLAIAAQAKSVSDLQTTDKIRTRLAAAGVMVAAVVGWLINVIISVKQLHP